MVRNQAGAIGPRLAAILVGMLAVALLLALHTFSSTAQAGPPIDDLDQLAQGRRVSDLSAYLDDESKTGRSPFQILKTNGAYEVGKYGWHALPLQILNSPDYVVFSTPLTSEDTGELVFRRMGGKLRFVPESTDFGVKLIRHDFDLRFDIRAKRAVLVDNLKLTSDGKAGLFMFRMSPQYLVSTITDSTGRTLDFKEAGGVVITSKPTVESTYTIRYSAVVNQPNYAGSISEVEASLTNDYWYPMVARQPVPYDITIHAPPGWIPVCQGDVVEERATSSEHFARYKMDLPCVFYSVTAGPFKKFSQVINGKTYSCWSSEMTQAQMEAQTRFYAPIIEFYSNTFCPFPFKGYGAVDSAVYGGGALEAYSFTTWGHGSLPAEDAHEPAHSWWGGIVDNNYLKSFWNESFAVFCEGLYQRGVPIGNVAERKWAFVRDGNGAGDYNSATIADSGADIGGVGSSLGYGKGSQVLQMLEVLLGTDKMVATMQGWIQQSRGTDSDWAAYESVVDRLNPEKQIKSFFDDWIRKRGFADLQVSEPQYTAGKVTLNVGFNGLSYRIPLEVMLQFADGSRSFATIDLKKPGPVTISCARKPVLVSVDPWRRILRKIDQDETPVELNTYTRRFSRYTDSAHVDYLPGVPGTSNVVASPTDIRNKFIVGNPATMPVLRDLCDRVGFKVDGDKLTYDGTTIDLNHGCAMAVIDLDGGAHCVIGLGKTLVAPDVGRARLALTDDLGRFLRGKTDPKTQGNLTFRL